MKSIISREGNWDEQGEERGKRENSRQEERCGALLARGDEKGKRDVNERRTRERGRKVLYDGRDEKQSRKMKNENMVRPRQKKKQADWKRRDHLCVRMANNKCKRKAKATTANKLKSIRMR